MTLVEQVYRAAAKAGLLQQCTWVSQRGMREVRDVEFRTTDDTVFDNLVMAVETTITVPSSYFQRAQRGAAGRGLDQPPGAPLRAGLA